SKWAIVRNAFSQNAYLNYTFCRFTPDGRSLIVQNLSDDIRIFHISPEGVLSQTGQVKGLRGNITSLAFSPDGKHVLTTHHGQNMRYWDLATGKVVHELPRLGAARYCKSCFINPKGTQALGCDGGQLILYELQSGRPIQRMKVSDTWTCPVAIAPDGRRVLVVVLASRLVMWQTLTGMASPPTEGSGYIYSVRFSPDGKYLILTRERQLEVWDADQLRLVEKFAASGGSISDVMAIAPDNKHVALVSGVGCDTLQVFRIPDSGR
ncbi:WD40 repeat domain-containing protein, partial [Candidatus Parcubacteria bacterium]